MDHARSYLPSPDRIATDSSDNSPKPGTKEVDAATLISGWDCFPQGDFMCRLSAEEFENLNGLKVEWAYKTMGGMQKKGSSFNASSPDTGKRSYRKCLGSLQCNNEGCTVARRPATKRGSKKDEVGSRCVCNTEDTDYRLQLVPCNNTARIVKWKGGVVYWNGISHNHGRFSNKKRLSPLEQRQTEELVKANPTATPAALRSGNTVSGDSLIDVSDRYVTENVVRNEVRKVRGPKLPSGDTFIARFHDLQKKCPGFVKKEHLLDGVGIISCQTSWMAERLAEAGNGMAGFSGSVTDAAHGWFEVPTSLLITTSVFCPLMQRWVPAFYSYSSGASSTHYKFYFGEMMRSVRDIKEKLGQKVQPSDFNGTMDYSQAQSLGFEDAFVEFFLEDPENTLSEPELRALARKCLHGCGYHYDSQITRVGRIVAIVSIDKRAVFKRLARRLRRAKDLNDLKQRAKVLVDQFPKAKRWVEWWTRPNVANMLILDRSNSEDSRTLLPDTTNAQEAAHFSMYSRQGKKHELIVGLEKCYAIAMEHEKSWNGMKRGIPLYYGKSPLTHRQKLKDRIGRTKKSRSSAAIRQQARINKEKIRSYRPPDTVKALFGRSKKASASRVPRQPKPVMQRTPPSTEDEQLSVSPSSSTSELDYETAESSPPIRPRRVRFSEPSTPANTKSHIRQSTVSSGPVIYHAKPILGGSGDLQLVVHKALTEIQDTPWRDNSCWFDSGYTSLWSAVSKNFSKLAQLIASDAKSTSPTPFTPILNALDEHRRLLLSNPPRETISATLLKLKNTLCQHLLAIGCAVPSANGYENDTAWLSEALCASFKASPNPELANYFGAQWLRLRWCTGSDLSILDEPDTPSKIKLDHGIVYEVDRFKPLLRLRNSEYELCNGNFQTYLQQHTTNYVENAKNQVSHPCWRCRDGDMWCSGHTHQAEILVSLPDIMIVRIERETLIDEWDFPHIVYPVPGEDAKKAGLKYEAVGRIFYDGNHFIARYTTSFDTPMRKPGVFFYDGARSREGQLGISIKETGGIRSNLGGWNIPMPRGYSQYFTTSVIYKLEGGLPAQEWFWSRQREHLKAELGLTLGESYPQETLFQPTWNSPDVFEFSAADMAWLSTRSAPLDYREYAKRDSLGKTLTRSSRPNPVTTVDYESDHYNSSSETKSVDRFFVEAAESVATRPTPSLDDFNPLSSPEPKGELLKLNSQAIESRAKVKERLRCGQMVLVQDGPLFWYPARLIQHAEKSQKSSWTVQWYRGNQVHETGSHTPGATQQVPASKIVDSLWGDVRGRRAIRLGRWMTTAELSEMEEAANELKYQIVHNPKKSVKYTALIDGVLQPHKSLFEQLVFNREQLNPNIPVLKFLQAQRVTVVPFDGGFPLETQSEVINWLYTNIPGIQETAPRWIVDGTLQHGLMLLILRDHVSEFEAEDTCPKDSAAKDKYVHQRAWATLQERTPKSESTKSWVDEERKSLAVLERKMFEQSKSAGHAGNCQWGLDVGIHQEGWSPYLHFRDWEIDHDRDNEKELETSRRFKTDSYTLEWNKAEKMRRDEEQKKLLQRERPKPRKIRRGVRSIA